LQQEKRGEYLKGDRCENWDAWGKRKMRLLIEVVIIVAVIFIAVRMFRKRG